MTAGGRRQRKQFLGGERERPAADKRRSAEPAYPRWLYGGPYGG